MNPEKRILQKTLAKEVTVFIHGEAEFEAALKTTEKLFADSGSIESLSETDLHALEGIVQSEFSRSRLEQGIDVVGFLSETGILPSKGEARKLVQNGGVSINRQKVATVQFNVDARLLLHDQYILVQKGKRNFFLVTAK
jgi:tyrosyl-tRNA synthetase